MFEDPCILRYVDGDRQGSQQKEFPFLEKKQRQTFSAERERVGIDSNGRNVDGKHKRYAPSKCELPLHQYPFGIGHVVEMLST